MVEVVRLLIEVLPPSRIVRLNKFRNQVIPYCLGFVTHYKQTWQGGLGAAGGSSDRPFGRAGLAEGIASLDAATRCQESSVSTDKDGPSSTLGGWPVRR